MLVTVNPYNKVMINLYYFVMINCNTNGYKQKSARRVVVLVENSFQLRIW